MTIPSSTTYIPFGDSTKASTNVTSDSKTGSTNVAATNDNDSDDDLKQSSAKRKRSRPLNKNNNNNTLTFGEQVTKFFAMATPYFRENREGRCMFIGLIVLMLLDSAVTVAFSYLVRDFWNALEGKDSGMLAESLRNFLIALLVLAPVNVFYRFQRQRLAIRWRKWMTERILHLYFYSNHQIYYKLEQQQQQQQSLHEPNRSFDGTEETSDETSVNISNWPSVDNPDQRIAEDVRSFTEYSLTFFLTIAVSTIDLAAFSTVLYLIEPMLFLYIFLFASVGTAVTVLMGQGLVHMNFERFQREADFRLSLVRIRSNAESIAFFRGEESEGNGVMKRFSSVVANAYDIIGLQRTLELFTTPYNYFTWVIVIVIIAPRYIAGDVELGEIQQAAQAFSHVLSDLSLIINQFETLSAFTASIGRLNQFLRAIQLADPDRDEQSPLLGTNSRLSKDKADGLFKSALSSNVGVPPKEDTTKTPFAPMEPHDMIRMLEYPSSLTSRYALSIQNLRLDTPDGHRELISSLNLELKWGEQLLVHGMSGLGKSSILRAIAGLWTSGSGTIEHPNKDDIYFLPQRPYCPVGTLREQLLYPQKYSIDQNGDEMDKKESNISDSRLLEVLNSVKLEDLPTRMGSGDPFAGLNETADWSNMLSLGEQQRLAFGRILVHRPRLIIMDEATSACDVKTEETMYNLLRNMRTGGPGVNDDVGVSTTYISVGHRPTLLRYHDRRLHVFKNEIGKTVYSIERIQSSSSEDGLASEEVSAFYR